MKKRVLQALLLLSLAGLSACSASQERSADGGSDLPALYRKAKEETLAGNVARGKAAFRDLLHSEPAHTGAIRWLCRIALLEEDYTAAGALALRGIALDPDNPEFHIMLARCGRLTGAGNPFDHVAPALASAQIYREALMETAALLRSVGSLAQAEALEEEACALEYRR